MPAMDTMRRNSLVGFCRGMAALARRERKIVRLVIHETRTLQHSEFLQHASGHS